MAFSYVLSFRPRIQILMTGAELLLLYKIAPAYQKLPFFPSLRIICFFQFLAEHLSKSAIWTTFLSLNSPYGMGLQQLMKILCLIILSRKSRCSFQLNTPCFIPLTISNQLQPIFMLTTVTFNKNFFSVLVLIPPPYHTKYSEIVSYQVIGYEVV